jgi:hypothetical protein
MKIWGNGKGASLALLMPYKEWSIYCKTGRMLVLGLSSLVCKLMMLLANLRDLLSLNTIIRGFLTCQNLQNAACAMSHNSKNKINPKQNE